MNVNSTNVELWKVINQSGTYYFLSEYEATGEYLKYPNPIIRKEIVSINSNEYKYALNNRNALRSTPKGAKDCGCT